MTPRLLHIGVSGTGWRTPRSFSSGRDLIVALAIIGTLILASPNRVFAQASSTEAEAIDRFRADVDRAYKAGHFDQCITALLEYSKQDPTNGAVAYSLAMCYARKNDKELAFHWLTKAWLWGWGTKSGEIPNANDPTFAELRKDPRYDEFMVRITNRRYGITDTDYLTMAAADKLERSGKASTLATAKEQRMPGTDNAFAKGLEDQGYSVDGLVQTGYRVREKADDPDADGLDAQFADDGLREENLPWDPGFAEWVDSHHRQRALEHANPIAVPAITVGVTNDVPVATILGLLPIALFGWWLYARLRNNARWSRLLTAWHDGRADRLDYLRSHTVDSPQQAREMVERLALLNVGDARAARVPTGAWTTREAEQLTPDVPPQHDPAACLAMPLNALRRIALNGLDVTPWMLPLDRDEPFHFVVGLGKRMRVDMEQDQPKMVDSVTVFASLVYHIRFEGTIVRVKRITEARFIHGRNKLMLRGHVPGSGTSPIDWVHAQLSYLDQLMDPILDEELDRLVGRSTGAVRAAYVPVK